MGAIPAVARQVPPSISSTVNYRDSMGTFQIMKITTGQSLTGVADGVITRLRVAELYFRPGPAGAGAGPHCGPGCINYGGATYHTPIATVNASWDAKWIVGETPIQSDGSANFKAPARKPLFFQALNAKGQVVQTMRSWVTLQPGEVFSCMGCHESRLNPPAPLSYVPEAIKQAPLQIEQFYGARRGFTFDKEIQPILNSKCISCHNGTNSSGLDLRQGKAYDNLTKHGTCESSNKYINWFHAEDSPLLQPPYRAGSYKSHMDSLLDKGHKNVTMTDEEMRKIRAWIDLGVPHWGTYQEGNNGSEANLTRRNVWVEQEKKNINEFLSQVVGTIPQEDNHHRVVSENVMSGFKFSCSALRTGLIRIQLNVPLYADGQKVRINLYNQKGALVRTLFDMPVTAGNQVLTVKSGLLATGQYLMELNSPGIKKTLQVAILR
jgi:hypothetical protein